MGLLLTRAWLYSEPAEIGVARLLVSAQSRVRMHYTSWSAGQLAARAAELRALF